MNSKIVTSLLNDREGNFWVGTWKGVYKYDNNRFVTYNAEDGLASNNVLSVYHDAANSQILLGMLAGGLNIIKDGKVIQTSLTGNSVWSIERENDHSVWLGTTNGPVLYDIYSNRIINPITQLQNTIVYAIKKQSQVLFILVQIRVYTSTLANK